VDGYQDKGAYAMKNPNKDGILESAVRQAVEKLAEKGVEGCTTKDVILASFASLSLNGGVATSLEVRSISSEIKKLGWRIVGVCISTMLAIIIVLIFLP